MFRGNVVEKNIGERHGLDTIKIKARKVTENWTTSCNWQADPGF